MSLIAFDDDPKLRWLFCMTHPDDEISICAWIHHLVNVGSEVFISWTHHTHTRKGEAIRAASLLGVQSERLRFLHGADGRVCEQMPKLLPEFKRMIEDIAPDRICCGAFEQGHLDHDATNLLVNSSFDGPVFEIPFYYTYLTRRPIVNRFASDDGQEIRPLSKTEQRFKVRFARQFPSQAIWRNLVLDEARRILTRPRAERLKQTERMRLQTHKDFLKPNLPPALADRVVRSSQWSRWEAAAKAIL